MATEANQLNFQNSAPQAQDKIAKITQLTGDSESKTTDGNTMVTEAEAFNNEAKAAYTNLDGEKDDMDESIVRFSDRQRNFDTERENLFNLEGEAAGKARDLSMSAQELQSVAERAKYPAENALQAAKAYEQILDSVTQADEATREALASAEKALDMSDGVANKVTDALRQIEGMYDDAQNAKASVDNELGPKLEADVQLVSVLTDQTKKLKQGGI